MKQHKLTQDIRTAIETLKNAPKVVQFEMWPTIEALMKKDKRPNVSLDLSGLELDNYDLNRITICLKGCANITKLDITGNPNIDLQEAGVEHDEDKLFETTQVNGVTTYALRRRSSFTAGIITGFAELVQPTNPTGVREVEVASTSLVSKAMEKLFALGKKFHLVRGAQEPIAEVELNHQPVLTAVLPPVTCATLDRLEDPEYRTGEGEPVHYKWKEGDSDKSSSTLPRKYKDRKGGVHYDYEFEGSSDDAVDPKLSHKRPFPKYADFSEDKYAVLEPTPAAKKLTPEYAVLEPTYTAGQEGTGFTEEELLKPSPEVLRKAGELAAGVKRHQIDQERERGTAHLPRAASTGVEGPALY